MTEEDKKWLDEKILACDANPNTDEFRFCRIIRELEIDRERWKRSHMLQEEEIETAPIVYQPDVPDHLKAWFNKPTSKGRRARLVRIEKIKM